jgi:probable F420-dependent oxidoreductase
VLAELPEREAHMKFWQNLSWLETDQQIEVAKFAEAAGFEGVVHGDHFAFPQTIATPYPYAPDGKPPMSTDWNYPDCWVTIAAQAAVTTHLKFATGIYVLATRPPLVTAKATGTLAILSNNRAVVGVAPGWMEEEFARAGVPFEKRGKRMEECIVVLRKVWMGGPVAHHGEFYNFDSTRIEPMPGYALPIYTGGGSAVALARAGRLADGWIGGGNMPDEVPAMLAAIHAARTAAGRAHLPFEAIVPLMLPPDLDTFKRLEHQGRAMGITVSGMAFPFALTLGMTSSLDAKKRAMDAFAGAFIRPLAR